MADKKVSGMGANTTPDKDDLLHLIDNPAGTPSNEKIALSTLLGVNAKQYGAKGDGTTDDTAAILAAGETTNPVHITSGTYIVSNVSWSTNVELNLDDGAVIKHKDASTGRMLDSTARLIIRGGTLDGNKAGQTSRLDLISCTNGSDLILEGINFKNSVAAAIDADGVTGMVRVSGCKFTGMAEHGGGSNQTSKCINVNGSTETIDISGNSFIGDSSPTSVNVVTGGIFVSGTSTSVRLVDNYFLRIGQNNSANSNFVANIHLYTDADESIISNNVFIDNYFQPINMQNAKNVVCVGNIVEGYLGDSTGSQINWQYTRSLGAVLSNCNISNNIIDIAGDTTSAGITVDGDSTNESENCVISGNVITGGVHGIRVRGTSNLAINCNVISSVSTFGIELQTLNDNGPHINITGGVIENFGSVGIIAVAASNASNASISINNVSFDSTDGTPTYFVQLRGDSGALMERVSIIGCQAKGTASTADWQIHECDTAVVSGNLSPAATGNLSTSNVTTLYETGNSWQTLQTYTPSNNSTDRSWDANAAVTGTGIDVAATTGTNVALLSDHDALVAVVQELSDVVATLATDLKTQGLTL